jgi:Ca2+-binding RTX toxin-like protein
VLEGSTVAGNRATDGGGIAAAGGAVSMSLVTVGENVATGAGGGLWTRARTSIAAATIGVNEAGTGGGIAAGAPAVTVTGTVVAGNTAGTGRQCSRALTSEGGNVEPGRTCGFDPSGDLRADPRLQPLGAYGGPTPTMALAPGSPAIGVGGDCGGRDQRGAPRDRRCDAGAYELVRCLGRPVDIVGTAGDDDLSGGRGPDVFLGLGGDDVFQGSIGTDRSCGGVGDDVLIAGPGDDRSSGGAGDDRIRGEAGDDGIWGGLGRDRLVGGPGRDTCEDARGDRLPRSCEVLVAGTPRAGRAT